MKRKLLAAFALSQFMLHAPGAMAGPVGSAFTYQGELKQSGAVMNGPVTLTFGLFDAESGGNLVGSPIVQNSWLVDGRFTVSLDFGAAAFDNQERWLEIDVDGQPLAGRQKLTAAPFASFALNAPFQTAGNNIIYQAGNIGLGTATPLAKLHVQEGTIRADTSSSLNFTYAVYGRISSPSPNYLTAGVMGDAQNFGTEGKGVYGLHHGQGDGVYGESINGKGVHGRVQNNVAGYAGYFQGGRNYFEKFVGIGTEQPTAQLHVMGGSDSAPSWGGYAVLGNEAGANLSLDNNEIMARNSGEVATLALNANGGDVTLIQDGGWGVGIGTPSPAFTLHVNASAGKPGGGSWSLASDARLKKNVRPLNGALELLLSLRPVTFDYKQPAAINELEGPQIGFIAQDVEQVFPQWVDEASDGYKRLTFRGFEALTVEALRELRERAAVESATQQSQIDRLQAENQSLRDRLLSLESLVQEKLQSTKGGAQ